MGVEFRLLGSLEARLDDRLVDLGHARQRSVLAVLLIEVNRPVPADQLVERVWADRPAHDARGALYGYLSRLRRVLAATDEVCLARQPEGYLLTVDPLAVDLHRFHYLLAHAREAQDEDCALGGR